MAREISVRLDNEGLRARVHVEQIGAVDLHRMGDLAGHLTPEEQWGIDVVSLTVLGLA